jgi:hypothetical protein
MLQDYYAGDWVDALDELKTNIDERRVVASAGAYALGRKTDELIIDAMKSATNEVGDYSTDLTKELILSAVEQLNANDVPDDGRRFAVVGVQQWNQLLSMDEFVSAEYIGGDTPLVSGFETKKWLGLIWVLHNGLPVANNGRDCLSIMQPVLVMHVDKKLKQISAGMLNVLRTLSATVCHRVLL